VLLFGSWMIIDGGVLSSMSGLVIPYYSLSIAPAAAALTAIGTHEMWRTRATRFGRTSLAAIVLVSGVWGFWLLHRNGSWLPGLRWTLLVVSVLAAAMLLWTTHSRRWAMIALAVGMVAMLGGSAAYTAATLGQPHQVRLVAGPKVWSNGMVSPASNQRLVAMLAATRTTWSAAVDRSQPAAELELASRTPVMAIGGFGGKDPVPTLQGFLDEVRRHQVTYYVATGDDHRGGPHADIRKWVVAHFTPIQLGLVTAYDLSTYHD
jgi:4-amino-4-deoxy-L-arabinose transferase-like glycosyltransferase